MCLVATFVLCAVSLWQQTIYKTRPIANAATTFVIQMRGDSTPVDGLMHFFLIYVLADQFGNNRTSSNLDTSILLLGRVVVSVAGPYPETAGSSMRVSAFQSVVLADGVDSGFYIGRYIMQRTALRAGHLAYLRTSIGDDHNFLFSVLFAGAPALTASNQVTWGACWRHIMEA